MLENVAAPVTPSVLPTVAAPATPRLEREDAPADNVLEKLAAPTTPSVPPAKTFPVSVEAPDTDRDASEDAPVTERVSSMITDPETRRRWLR